MSDQGDSNSTNQGLSGILKLAIIISVILLAGLAIMLVTDIITREAFDTYLKTLLIVIGITTVASVVIALLQRSGKQ
jgi:hypothetical protein